MLSSARYSHSSRTTACGSCLSCCGACASPAASASRCCCPARCARASLVVGFGLGLVGRLGGIALLAAAPVAAARDVLLWQNRRMVAAERRTTLLLEATVAVQAADRPEDVEGIAESSATLLGGVEPAKGEPRRGDATGPSEAS